MQVIIRHISIYIVKGSCYRSGDISAESVSQPAVDSAVEISGHILVVYRLVVFLAAASIAAPQIQKTDVKGATNTQAHIAHRGCLLQCGEQFAGAVDIVDRADHILRCQQ